MNRVKLLSLVLAVALCVGFVSCDPEPDPEPVQSTAENNGDSSSGVDGDSEGDDPDEDSGKDDPDDCNYVLASVTVETRSPDGRIRTSEEFKNPVYMVDRWFGKTVLKSYDSNDESLYCQYAYNLPNSVSCYQLGYNTEYTLNSFGFIAESQDDYDESYTFEYDTKHRLISIATRYGGVNLGVEKLLYDDTFNIVGYKEMDDNQKISTDAKIYYTSIIAKTIPLQCLDFGNDPLGKIFYAGRWQFLEMGLFGNTIPLYLVDKVINCFNGEETEIDYDYTLDNNGYVTEMLETVYMTDITVIRTYRFEWKAVSVPTYTNWLFSDIGSPYYRYL